MDPEVKTIESLIFEDNELRNLIDINFDPWVGTNFQGYVYLDPKQKGNFGEIFTTKYMLKKGYKVDKTKKNNGPYDRYISNSNILMEKYDMIPTEIKFSLAQKNPLNKMIIKKN